MLYADNIILNTNPKGSLAQRGLFPSNRYFICLVAVLI